jgi:hypothetical protein
MSFSYTSQLYLSNILLFLTFQLVPSRLFRLPGETDRRLQLWSMAGTYRER